MLCLAIAAAKGCQQVDMPELCQEPPPEALLGAPVQLLLLLLRGSQQLECSLPKLRALFKPCIRALLPCCGWGRKSHQEIHL
jgi:hypothetical protein